MFKTEQLNNTGMGEMVLMNENFEGFDIKTVDLIDCPDFKEDCFNQTFWNEHLGQYALLIAPDCGGPWYKLQKEKRCQEFKRLLEGILTMVSERSIVILDKFIYPEFRDCALEVLLNGGFTIIRKEFRYGNGIFAIRYSC